MEDPKNIKEELTDEETKGVDAGNQQQWLTPPFMVTEDELKGVSGGDGVVTDVPGNPLGSLKEELTDEELKGLSGGVHWTEQDYKVAEQDGLYYPGM